MTTNGDAVRMYTRLRFATIPAIALSLASITLVTPESSAAAAKCWVSKTKQGPCKWQSLNDAWDYRNPTVAKDKKTTTVTAWVRSKAAPVQHKAVAVDCDLFGDIHMAVATDAAGKKTGKPEFVSTGPVVTAIAAKHCPS